MLFSKFLATASALVGIATAAPACRCSEPIVRKEWRTLCGEEKISYLDAVKCLAKQPSQVKGIYEGAKSRYDDFPGTHINFTDHIHFVGFFQAWHRVFVAQYEKDLRDLCGYEGAQPYWDWSLDCNSAEAFVNSPIFDETTGFGGNGVFIDTSEWENITLHIPRKTGGGCITGGPFTEDNWKVHMGPGPSTAFNPRCLTRDLAPEFAITKLSQAVVDWTLDAHDFFEFDLRVEGGITVPELQYHGGGHLGVGGDLGEVGDVYSSPSDPIFFMHHANMDRLWDKWQRLDWPARKSDIGGPDTQFAYPYDFFGAKPYQNVTLEYKMDFRNLIPGKRFIRVKDVMDTQGGELCYTYA